MDWALESLIDFITSSSSLDNDQDTTLQRKRSLRAVLLLIDDSNSAYELHASSANYHTLNDDKYKDLILNPTMAGLVAKKLFSTYRQLASYSSNNDILAEDAGGTTHLLTLLNKLLGSILHAFPSSVVGSACAGGKEGIDLSLSGMLTVHSQCPDELSPLSIITKLVVVGCTGRPYEPYRESLSTGHSPNTSITSDTLWVNKGHRRKFIRALIDSRFLIHAIDGIIVGEVDIFDDTHVLRMESLCDSLIAIIDSIAHPPIPTNDDGKKESMDESVGEEVLLSSLFSDEIIRRIMNSASLNTNPSSAARFLLALYESATGMSKKNTKGAAVLDGVEDDGEVNAKAVNESLKSEEMNKFLRYDLTSKIHATIISHMDILVQALDINSQPMASIEGQQEVDQGRIVSSVRHPGRYTVHRPFTSRRLNLITLLADVLSFESSSNTTINNQKNTFPAMDLLMTLPISIEEVEGTCNAIMNPWPGLCILLFDYPENNMFQNQFYRLLLAICLSNHESTLKLVVQKSKFISRSLSIFQNFKRNSSVRGVLIKCLNVLRLSSQSLTSQSFLRHFLDSHDQWKLFQSELIRLTMEQLIPRGGALVSSSSVDYFNLDLGSPFAIEIGFPLSKQKVVEDSVEKSPDASPSKSEKKKKKKKKKKSTDTSLDDDHEE